MSLEVFLARRYLSSQKGRGLSVITWIALAGVIVGVMSLVTVLAVMSGFERDLKEKILGNNAHILVELSRTQVPDQKHLDDVLGRIRKEKGIKAAMPVIYGQGFVLGSSGGAQGVFVKGVDPENVKQVLDLGDYVRFGDWSKFKENGVILGESLAESLGLQTGESLTLVLNQGEFSPLGMTPRMVKLKIVDVFHSGMTQYDSRHLYMPLDTAERIFEMRPRAIEIKTTDIRELSKIRDQIRTDVPEAVDVSDWLSLNKDFLSALRLEKTAMAVILGLIVLVAAFNICGSLIMVVHDKTRDIAILKSMGAFDGSVLKIFLYQGFFIGVVGTVAGVILGIILSILLKDYIQFPLNQEVYMIDTLPVDLRALDIFLVTVGALIVSLIATSYPAMLAARLLPTEGLKAES